MFNRLDDILAPRAGYLVKLQLGGATKLVLSDQNFARTTAKVQYLHPVGKIGTLLFRAEAGVVFAKSVEGIPTDYLFRTGGDTTVRGYAFDSLGVAQGTAVVGGRYLAVASAEYIHWLSKTWGVAVFYDAGNAADDAKGTQARRRLRRRRALEQPGRRAESGHRARGPIARPMAHPLFRRHQLPVIRAAVR